MNKYRRYSSKNIQKEKLKNRLDVFICHINENEEFCKRHKISNEQLKRHPWIYIKKWKVMFLLQHNHGNKLTENNKYAYKIICADKLTNKKEKIIVRIDHNIRGIKNVEDIAFLEAQHQAWENNKSHYFWQYIEIGKHLKPIQTLFKKWIKNKKR